MWLVHRHQPHGAGVWWWPYVGPGITRAIKALVMTNLDQHGASCYVVVVRKELGHCVVVRVGITRTLKVLVITRPTPPPHKQTPKM